MTLKIFYNEFIYKTSAIHHERIKTSLLPKIESSLGSTKDNQVDKWFCDVNTEFFTKTPDTSKYIELITSEIYPAVDRMFSHMPQLNIPKTSSLTHIWYNRYESNNTQEVHSHAKGTSTNPVISGVYILELNERNPLVFFSQLASSNRLINDAIRMDDAKEGDILLFPSAMPHYVLPCKTTRTTIAFNITCSF